MRRYTIQAFGHPTNPPAKLSHYKVALLAFPFSPSILLKINWILKILAALTNIFNFYSFNTQIFLSHKVTLSKSLLWSYLHPEQSS